MSSPEDLTFAMHEVRLAVEAADIEGARKWFKEVERIEFDLVTQGIQIFPIVMKDWE